MIKLAVFDLDNTMLNDSSRLPQNFEKSMKRLKELGVQTAVASARAYFSIAELFGDRNADLMGFCDNGNTIFKGKSCTILNCWKEDDIRYLCSFIEQDSDIGLIFSGTDHYYTDSVTKDRCVTHENLWMLGPLKDIDEAISMGKPISNCHFICFWESYPSIRACVQEKLTRSLSDIRNEFSLLDAGWGWIAVGKDGLGKAAGIRRLMETLGCTPDETCVFGDSANDIPMFMEVTHSFAMKNANADVKVAASYVTDEDNNHNGALKAAIALAEKLNL